MSLIALRGVVSRFVITGFVLVLAGIVGGGCATTTDRAMITYVAQPGVTKVQGADAVTLKVVTNDARTDKARVSCKKNGYGMEMAAIVPVEDVSVTVQRAIETELGARGFVCAESTTKLSVEIVKFWNDFKIGVFAGDAVAEVMLNVDLKRADGTLVYHKTVTASGKQANIQLASGKNAQAALGAALRDATDKLFSDGDFVKALLNSKATAVAVSQ